MENIRKLKKRILIAELIVLSALLAALFFKALNRKEIWMNFVEFQSDIMRPDGNSILIQGEEWNQDKAPEKYDEDAVFVSGMIGDLKKGSYTLVLQYDTEEVQFCGLRSEKRGRYLHSHPFHLSINKKKAEYHFWLEQDISDLEVCFFDYGGGTFRLNSVRVEQNTQNLQILLFIAVIACLFLNFVLFSRFYREHRTAVITVITLAVLTSAMLFLEGMAPGHDSDFHLARIEGIAEGIRSGQFPVRMYPFVNDDYGYPAGIFYGDLLLYVPALLRIIGFTVINSYKLYIFFVGLLSAASIHFCASKIFKKEKTAILVSSAYMVSGYRFLDIYVRAAVGEYSAFVFFPLIYLGMRNLYVLDPGDRQYGKNALWIGLGVAGLIYTHILSTEIIMEILFVFALVNFRKTFRKETFLTILKSAGICLALSLAFVVPFLHYYFTSGVEITTTAGTAHYIQQLGAFISGYFAVFRNFFGYASGDVSGRFQLSPGLLQMLAVLSAGYLILKKQSSRELNVTFAVSLILLFVSSNLFPWNWVTDSSKLGLLLTTIQYPWRFLAPAVTTLSILAGHCFERMEELNLWNENTWNTGILLCFVMLCVFVSSYMDNTGQTHIIDKPELHSYSGADGWGFSIGASEYTLPDTSVSLLDYEIQGENASGTLVSESGVNLTLDADAGSHSWLEVPRFHLPYFRVTDENGTVLPTEAGFNNKIRILFETGHQGRLTVKFVTPWFVKAADLISLFSVIWLMTGGIRKRFGKEKNNKKETAEL
ncbi:MAG: hypothetical protein IKD66_11530 [Solobacterium sp.]|nr:hypothetical protein [Solobacterium sp.]